MPLPHLPQSVRVRASERPDLLEPDQLVETLEVIELGHDRLRGAGLENGLVAALDRGSSRQERGGREDRETKAERFELLAGEHWRTPLLDHVGDEREIESLPDLAQLLLVLGRLDKEDVGAGFGVGS